MGNFSEFLRTNLIHALPVLIVGVMAIVIIVERLHALTMRLPMLNAQGFFEKIRDLVMADQIAEAIALCDKYRAKPVASVVREGLLRAHQPEALIEDGLQIALAESTARVTKRTSFLATFANVATLMGLFGTILGLITSFGAVNQAAAQERAAALSSGIATAMYATLLGLGVAIPCMIFFSFLMNRTNRIIAESEQAAVRTMDVIRQRYYAAENDPAKIPGSRTA